MKQFKYTKEEENFFKSRQVMSKDGEFHECLLVDGTTKITLNWFKKVDNGYLITEEGENSIKKLKNNNNFKS